MRKRSLFVALLIGIIIGAVLGLTVGPKILSRPVVVGIAFHSLGEVGNRMYRIWSDGRVEYKASGQYGGYASSGWHVDSE